MQMSGHQRRGSPTSRGGKGNSARRTPAQKTQQSQAQRDLEAEVARNLQSEKRYRREQQAKRAQQRNKLQPNPFGDEATCYHDTRFGNRAGGFRAGSGSGAQPAFNTTGSATWGHDSEENRPLYGEGSLVNLQKQKHSPQLMRGGSRGATVDLGATYHLGGIGSTGGVSSSLGGFGPARNVGGSRGSSAAANNSGGVRNGYSLFQEKYLQHKPYSPSDKSVFPAGPLDTGPGTTWSTTQEGNHNARAAGWRRPQSSSGVRRGQQ